MSLRVGGFGVGLLLCLWASAAPAATTRRVSVGVGVQGDAGSYNPQISEDGRYVAFDSDASNLVSGDTNYVSDVFVYDTQTGLTTRVSVSSAGVQGNGGSFLPSISSDGRYVAFESDASSLVPSDTNGATDIFVHDCQTGATTRVSVATGGAQSNGGSHYPYISSNGRYVVFESDAANLDLVTADTNGFRDIFIHDRQTGETTRVSLTYSGGQANGTSELATVSADGRYVAFDSAATNLVSGDSNRNIDVFVRDRQAGTTKRASVSGSGNQAHGDSWPAWISANGRYVTFASDANDLVASDANAVLDAFVRDLQANQTTRVSVSSGGAEGNGASQPFSISPDGAYVVFQSAATNLVAGDNNGAADIFVRERNTSQTVRVSLGVSGAQANGGSAFAAISSDGSRIALESDASNLVALDTNAVRDVFLRDRLASSYTLALSGSHGLVRVNSVSCALPWSGSFSSGELVYLGAVADPNYHFSGWSGDASGTANPTSVTMTANKSIGVGFAINSYTLSLTGSHGSVKVNSLSCSLPWSGSFDYGSLVSLEAVADTGYHFTAWLGDVGGTANPTSLTMTANKSVSVGFAINSYSLTLTGSHGSVKVNSLSCSLPWSGSFDYGTLVSLEAVPEGGYHFSAWSGDLVSSANPTSLTMTANRAIGAGFAINTYTLSLTGSHGQVKVNSVPHALPWSASFDYGSLASLEAMPEAGYHFSSWTGDLTGSLNPTSVTMTGNQSIGALFAINSYTLSLSGSHGSVKVNGATQALPYSGSFDHGTLVSLEGVPESGYHFSAWSGDLVSSANPASVTMTANESISVLFVINSYTLSLTGSHGSVKVNGSAQTLPYLGSFDHGTLVELEGVAEEGYHFGGWSGDLGGSANPTLVTMTSSKSLGALFLLNSYTLTLTGSHGSVKVNGATQALPYSGSFDHGALVSLEALPEDAYHFREWSGDVTGTANPTSLIMTANQTVEALFAINSYTLSLTGSHGQVKVNSVTCSLPWSGSFDYGSLVSLEAVPEAGYHFSSWSGDLTGSANPTSVTITAEQSIAANFTINVYPLTLTGSHGQVKVNGTPQALPYSHSFDHGTLLELEALPDIGYHFSSWSGDLGGSANPTSVTMTGAKAIGAGFSLNAYTLSLTGSHGQVSVNGTPEPLPCSRPFDYGEVVTLEALPDTGYHFSQWSGDLSGSANPTTVTVSGDKTVTAGFAINSYSLSLSGSHGQVRVNSVAHSLPWSGSFTHGEVVNLEAVADGGYHFTGWSGDLMGGVNPTSVTMTASKSVTAGFAINTYTLNLVGSHGQVKVNGVSHSLPWAGAFDDGTTVNLEAVADTGYHFTAWSGDLSGSANPASFSIAADGTITAGFAINSYTLSLTGSHGQVMVNGASQALPYSGSFDHGALVSLEGVPDSGYHFTAWSGDLTGSANPATVTMTGEKTIGVGFGINAYTLSLNGTHGQVKVNSVSHALPWSGSFSDGEAANLEAAPETGYHFVEWSGDLAGSENPVTVTMTADKTIAADFAINAYTLTLTGSHGQISVNGTTHALPYSASFEHGAEVSLEAVADEGYHFTAWSGDLSGSANPVSVTLTGDRTISVGFATNAYTLTLNGSHGQVKVNSVVHALPWSGSFSDGEIAGLEAVPDTGYHFTAWSGDLSGSVNPTSVTMVGDRTITAGFAINSHTLTLNGSHGQVKVNSVARVLPWSGSFSDGEVAELEAVADANYHFAAWSGDLTGSANPTSVTVTGDKTITVGFAINTHALTLTGSHGQVKVNGTAESLPYSASFDHGTAVDLEAVADPGYHFGAWSGDVSGSTNPTSVTMNVDKTVAAGFAINTYTLGMTGSHGQVKVNGVARSLPYSGSFDHGTLVDLEAVPDTGYHFTAWSGDLSGTANPTSVTLDSDKTVAAGFAINSYTLTLNGSHGQVEVNGVSRSLPWSGSFDHGAVANLEAVADTGYHFTAWSGDLTGAANPTSVTMTASKTVAAGFAINSYTLSLTGGHGQVKVNGVTQSLPYSGPFDYGTVVSLEAAADTGYHFSGWSGDASGTANPTSVTMTANKSIGVGFAINSYTLSLTGSHGSVKVNSLSCSLPWSGSFDYGSLVSLEAVADTGYHFTAWLGDVGGTANPTSLTMTANKSVSVGFAINSYSLTLTGSHGSVKVNSLSCSLPWSGSFDYGTLVSLEAVPEGGYHFSAWSGDLVSSANPTSLTMTANRAIGAGFAINTYTLSLTGSHGQVKVNSVPHALPWSASFDYGSLASLEAMPEAGYHFSSWTGDLTGSLNPTSVTMTGNQSIGALFAINSYTLSLSGSHGSVKVNGATQALPYSGSFDHGTLVSLEGVPESGYHFSAWSGDLVSSANPASVTMTANESISVLFVINSYTLSLTGSHGSVKVNGSAQTLPYLGSFDHGTLVELEGVAEEGYHFGGWSGDLGGSANPTLVTMTSSKSLGALFLLNSYTLTLTGSHGSVKVNGATQALPYSGSFDHGALVSLEALPEDAYHFREWSGDVTGTANPTSLIMTANQTVEALFAINSYTLSLTGSHGQVKVNSVTCSLPWSGSFDYGSLVSLEAVPEAGYHFSSWSGDLTGSANPTSVTITAEQSIAANFTINVYPLTLTGSHGQVKVNGTPQALPYSHSFDHGTLLELEALPDIGYHFSSWSGDLGGSANPTSVTMTGAKAIGAGFSLNAYTLSLTGSHGQVSVNGTPEPLPCSRPFDYGEVVTLEALPDTGYHFSQWSGDLSGSANPTTVTISGDTSIAVGFVANPCVLTITGIGSGAVWADGVECALPWSASYDCGAQVLLEAVPAAGSQFICWAGGISSHDNPLTLTVDGDTAVQAVFYSDITFTDIPTNYWAYDYIRACVNNGIVQGYSWDNTYRPDLIVTRDQGATFISRALAGSESQVPPGPDTPSFADVPTNHWAYKYIEYAYAQGVVVGYWDGYHPGEAVSRAQLAVLISRSICDPVGEQGLIGYAPPATPSFADVPTDYWAYKYIEYAHEHGVVQGYWNGYHPEELVNRAQLAVYIARAFELPL
jgi:hypothetical protein